jgi:hypothetical protein
MITFDKVTQEIQGWLIDLDHAKYDEDHEQLTIGEMAEHLPSTEEDEDKIAEVIHHYANGRKKRRGPDRQLMCFFAWLMYLDPSTFPPNIDLPNIRSGEVIYLYEKLLQRYEVSDQVGLAPRNWSHRPYPHISSLFIPIPPTNPPRPMQLLNCLTLESIPM